MTALIERLQAAFRTFVTGPVDNTLGEHWGHDDSQFSPPEYGDYLATSNGVYACSKLRAQLLSGLNIKAYRTQGDDKVQIEAGPLVELLHKVNPFWTMNRLLEMTEMSLCAWGESYWFLERGLSGKQTPQEIWWARPDRVQVVPHENDYISHFIYRGTDGQDLTFAPWEVVWLRYPNPIDQFTGLSPLAAARLAADSASAAMKSNLNLFKNGLQIGGFLSPADKSTTYSPDQAKELERDLERRFKGVNKAHRWAVLRFQAQTTAGVSPKDAEFTGLLKWTLEDICRAYGVPLDLIGGERTYQNTNDARKAIWTQTMLPEARFIASELTEQMAAMFPGQVDTIEFDTSEIEELHEEETAAWERNKEQIQVSAITINEWRANEGLDDVEWGDIPYHELRATANPFSMPPEDTTPPEPRAQRALTRAIEYGSPEHERIWQRQLRRTEPFERELGQIVEGLFNRQSDGIRDKLRNRSHQRGPADDMLSDVFDMSKWVKAFRVAVRPVLRKLTQASANDSLDDLGIIAAFNVDDPLVVRFLERRAQRFATHVNDTTWKQLKKSLAEGLDAGETIREFEDRVQEVMGDRIESSTETIARTEVNSVLNQATEEAWRQSDVVSSKRWLSALDERTRTPPDSNFDHLGAHGETVALDEMFVRTGESIERPGGESGSAGNVVNCRCSLTALLK